MIKEMIKKDKVIISNFFSYLGSKITLDNRFSTTVKELTQIKEEKEELKTQLEKEKSELRHSYEAEITRLEKEMAEIHKGYEAEIARLEREIEEGRNQLNIILSQLSERLSNIESSLSWRLILRYRRIRDRLLPESTRRREFYRLFLVGSVVLFKEGPGEFFRKAISHIRSKRRTKQKNNRSVTVIPEVEWEPLSFPQFKEIEASIIIPVHNQSHYTYRCLQTILKKY